MNGDIINLIQILLFFICIASIFSYAIYSYRNIATKINFKYINYLFIQKLKYTRKLSIRDYSTFEKFDIWRFCTQS